MKSKKIKDPNKPAWQVWWELAKFPARVKISKKLSRADVVFCLMRFMGMSKIDSFLTAYPDTKASRNSLAAMATRKCQEPWVQEYLDALYEYDSKQDLKFNYQA